MVAATVSIWGSRRAQGGPGRAWLERLPRVNLALRFYGRENSQFSLDSYLIPRQPNVVN